MPTILPKQSDVVGDNESKYKHKKPTGTTGFSLRPTLVLKFSQSVSEVLNPNSKNFEPDPKNIALTGNNSNQSVVVPLTDADKHQIFLDSQKYEPDPSRHGQTSSVQGVNKHVPGVIAESKKENKNLPSIELQGFREEQAIKLGQDLIYFFVGDQGKAQDKGFQAEDFKFPDKYQQYLLFPVVDMEGVSQVEPDIAFTNVGADRAEQSSIPKKTVHEIEIISFPSSSGLSNSQSLVSSEQILKSEENKSKPSVPSLPKVIFDLSQCSFDLAEYPHLWSIGRIGEHTIALPEENVPTNSSDSSEKSSENSKTINSKKNSKNNVKKKHVFEVISEKIDFEISLMTDYLVTLEYDERVEQELKDEKKLSEKNIKNNGKIHLIPEEEIKKISKDLESLKAFKKEFESYREDYIKYWLQGSLTETINNLDQRLTEKYKKELNTEKDKKQIEKKDEKLESEIGLKKEDLKEDLQKKLQEDLLKNKKMPLNEILEKLKNIQKKLTSVDLQNEDDLNNLHKEITVVCNDLISKKNKEIKENKRKIKNYKKNSHKTAGQNTEKKKESKSDRQSLDLPLDKGIKEQKGKLTDSKNSDVQTNSASSELKDEKLKKENNQEIIDTVEQFSVLAKRYLDRLYETRKKETRAEYSLRKVAETSSFLGVISGVAGIVFWILSLFIPHASGLFNTLSLVCNIVGGTAIFSTVKDGISMLFNGIAKHRSPPEDKVKEFFFNAFVDASSYGLGPLLFQTTSLFDKLAKFKSVFRSLLKTVKHVVDVTSNLINNLYSNAFLTSEDFQDSQDIAHTAKKIIWERDYSKNSFVLKNTRMTTSYKDLKTIFLGGTKDQAGAGNLQPVAGVFQIRQLFKNSKKELKNQFNQKFPPPKLADKISLGQKIKNWFSEKEASVVHSVEELPASESDPKIVHSCHGADSQTDSKKIAESQDAQKKSQSSQAKPQKPPKRGFGYVVVRSQNNSEEKSTQKSSQPVKNSKKEVSYNHESNANQGNNCNQGSNSEKGNKDIIISVDASVPKKNNPAEENSFSTMINQLLSESDFLISCSWSAGFFSKNDHKKRLEPALKAFQSLKSDASYQERKTAITKIIDAAKAYEKEFVQKTSLLEAKRQELANLSSSKPKPNKKELIQSILELSRWEREPKKKEQAEILLILNKAQAELNILEDVVKKAQDKGEFNENMPVYLVSFKMKSV